MLKIENAEVVGWEHAIRGMRNPMNSWGKSDSFVVECNGKCSPRIEYESVSDILCMISLGKNVVIGPNDQKLMTQLAKAGTDHRKFMRMITVYLDITAPLYWWKEFDTYKVGTVANSCSTMHKIAEKEFELEDFSCEHLISDEPVPTRTYSAKDMMEATVANLNQFRQLYLDTKDKKYWWQMIQLLPSSYNQKRTVMLNYEVLANIYKSRRNHKLDEWHTLCDWIETLPLSEIITGKEENGK